MNRLPSGADLPVRRPAARPAARPVPLRKRSAFLLSLLLWPGVSAAAGPQPAPRRPPGPFAVFVHASDPEDAALQADLDKATREVRDWVRRRGNWFRLAESDESADLALRVTNYYTSQVMLPKLERLILDGRVTMVERSEVVEFHYVDAVAIAGEARENLTGLDERTTGASLRNAASHLAEELERFCKDNYASLTSPR